MSDRDSFQDSSDRTNGALGDASKEGLGNRPAENARHATSPSGAEQLAPRQEGAGDFLGLGCELDGLGLSASSDAASASAAPRNGPSPVLPAWMSEAESAPLQTQSATAQVEQNWLLDAGEAGPQVEAPAAEGELVAASSSPSTSSFKERGLHGFVSVWGVRLLLGAAAASLVFVTLHVYKSAQPAHEDAVTNAPLATKVPRAGGATTGAQVKTGRAPTGVEASTKTARAGAVVPIPEPTNSPVTASTGDVAVALNPDEVELPGWWPVARDDAHAAIASSTDTGVASSTSDAANADASHAASPRSSDARVETFVEGQGVPSTSIASLVPWTRSPAMPARSSVDAGEDALVPDLDAQGFASADTIVFAGAESDDANSDRATRDDTDTDADLATLPRAVETADLAGMWLEATIPLDHVGDATRLLTPAVGRVRVILTNNEVFEGRLQSVGEKKVWIDTSLGRMGLVDTQIARIEAASQPTGSELAQTRQELMPTVRVQTSAGIIYGKLAARTQHDLTLILDSGLESIVVPTRIHAAPKYLAVLGITKAALPAKKSTSKPGTKPSGSGSSKSAKPKRS